jgi:NAD(P)-dependent dehydrogenase (short-subunit alcohol dehydrogenase family)
VVERLLHDGWSVRVIDRRPEGDRAGVDYQVCDITDYAAVREGVRGCQAVVHLAAIPNPIAVPGPELFPINVTGTYNVFEAAAAEGIRRVVQASSINAFGCFWGTQEMVVDYFPIDEAHRTHTTDVYSFSKELVEDIGAYYWRREGISSLALRFPGVWSHTRMTSPEGQQQRARARTLIDEFAAQPEAKRLARLAALQQATQVFRAQKQFEYPLGHGGIKREGNSDDPLWPVYAFERFNFWAYVDERDAAQAVAKGLRAEFAGAHALFINASTNSLAYDAQPLARLFFPEVTEWRAPLADAASLVSIAKAQTLIGYAPEHGL